MNTLNVRFLYADTIIFLDIPRFRCLWRVIKRTFLHYGKTIPGNPKECPQKHTFEFLKWIWNYNKRYRESTLDSLENLRDKKNIYIFIKKRDQ
jgi:adenylate kinase family enzyme